MRTGIRLVFACLVAVPGIGRSIAGDEPPAPEAPANSQPNSNFEPTADYRVMALRGWTLRISSQFGPRENELLRKVLCELNRQLREIEQAVSPTAVDALRRIEIWIELDDPRFPCMYYHAHERWLRAHGVNPEKTGHVELANARNFLTWTRQQPSMVLHELAHGYHDRFLPHGYRNQRIIQAYQAALEDDLYGEVRHVGGATRDHYAATNPMEYFAESTEAWFGRNDFFPFECDELIAYDPGAARLLRRLWQRPSPVEAPRPTGSPQTAQE